MIDKIIVNNNVRVGKFIGTTIKHQEDILLNNNIKIKEFIKKYYNYLNSCKEKDIIQFFKLTGLILKHEYIEKDSYKRISFSSNGVYSWDFDKLENKPYSYNYHFIIETYVDTLEVCEDKIIANGEEIYSFEDIQKRDVNSSKWDLSTLNIDERIEYLKKKNYILPNANNVKDILLDPFDNVLTLEKNGNMYVNDYLYCTGVEYIFELNSTDLKIIYKNMEIEDYSSHLNGITYEKYKKVLYNDNFLATIKNELLTIYLCLSLGYNKSVYLNFDQVTDIRYIDDSNVLVIIKDKKEILLPLDSVMLFS